MEIIIKGDQVFVADHKQTLLISTLGKYKASFKLLMAVYRGQYRRNDLTRGVLALLN